jgi:hypothetical protein
MHMRTLRRLWCGLAATLLAFGLSAQAQTSRNLAPGFSTRPAGSTLVVVPADLELFAISGGGVMEPKADWTEAASRHFRSALESNRHLLGAKMARLADSDLDELSEINALHGAVAQSIFVHHVLGYAKLPTKNDLLDWTLGDAVKPLKAKTGADYALFTWIRDSYATAERKMVMVAMALLNVGVAGGAQVGYASLVDLNTGRVVWFNDLRRGSGDLREAKEALETVDTLLKGFPALR